MTPDENPHFFDKPGNVKLTLRVLYVACAILLAVDFIHHRHVLHDWENLWGFYAFYGFVACWLLVELAKLMRVVLMRPPDYYEED